MSTVVTPAPAQRETNAPPPATGVRLDRMIFGLLLGVAGVGWMLDEAGLSVPWRLLPAAALILVGLVLVGSLAGGRGRAGLVALGLVLLVIASAGGIGADRFAGTAGDRFVTPTAEEWPVTIRHSAGNVTVDLNRDSLPPAGQMEVRVGAGRIELTVPRDRQIRIEAQVATGNIRVDGVQVGDGIDVRWSEPGASGADVVVRLDVAVGEIEVNHE